MRRWFFIILALVCAGKVLAEDASTDFSSANQWYAEGKFSDAAMAYEKILQTGLASPNLLFNYGNAEFKAGNLGKAIAAFRDAELLAPRDSEIRANLDFARNQVQGVTLHESRWQDWLGQLTLNEWTFLAAGALWLTFLLLAAKQYRPRLAPKLRGATSLFIFLTILFGAVTGLQTMEHFSGQSAVIVSDAVTRSGPFADAQSVFAVHDGAEFSVVDHHGDWVQVADGSGRTGWLSGQQVALIPGA